MLKEFHRVRLNFFDRTILCILISTHSAALSSENIENNSGINRDILEWNCPDLWNSVQYIIVFQPSAKCILVIPFTYILETYSIKKFFAFKLRLVMACFRNDNYNII